MERFDRIDCMLLEQLAGQGRLTWTELGALVGLTGPAVAERVRKLEQAGVIQGYAALLEPARVGADLTAFIAVTVERPDQSPAFLARVGALPAVQECHHVAGEDSYLLKVRTAGTGGLERLISEQIKAIPGVVRTRSTIVLSTSKESPVPPILIAEDAP